jgi:Protein of unknown function (DUF3263)
MLRLCSVATQHLVNPTPSVLGRSPVPACGELRGADVENYAWEQDGSQQLPQTPQGTLAERERGVLAFERQWWRHAGAKEEAIRREFGIGPTAYYQLLSRLLDDPAALALDPMLVKRLQRQRAARRRRRASRRLDLHGPTEGS